MPTDPIYYRRNLPHYQPPSATFFVTFRLRGSLPKEVVEQLKEEQMREQARIRRTIQDKNKLRRALIEVGKRSFARYDKYLDTASNGSHWLSDDRVVAMICQSIHNLDGKEYDLICYCLMSNHVHMVFSLEQFSESFVRDTVPNYVVTDIIGNLKKYTAHRANLILKRSGGFWQHESYDHVVRSGEELQRIICYVLNNPVKAGLVKEWNQWKWSYCNPKYL